MAMPSCWNHWGRLTFCAKETKDTNPSHSRYFPEKLWWTNQPFCLGLTALGLITSKADKIFSLTSAVKDFTGKRIPTYQASESFSHILGSFQLCSSWRDSRACFLEQGNHLYKFLLAWYARFSEQIHRLGPLSVAQTTVGHWRLDYAYCLPPDLPEVVYGLKP